jgi:hypothetical protein
MKRLTIIASIVVALAILGGIAWALWSANSVTHVTLQLSAKPAANITFAGTNDDEVVTNPLWDPLDVGPDPSSPGPLATRYASDIALCTANTGPTITEATVGITAAYGGYYCDIILGIVNQGGGAWKLTQAKVNTVTSLADCPTMASTDLNADTQPDVEACIAKLANDSSVQAPVLLTIWGPGEARMVKLSLHVLDTASGGATRLFDFTTVGEAQ